MSAKACPILLDLSLLRCWLLLQANCIHECSCLAPRKAFSLCPVRHCLYKVFSMQGWEAEAFLVLIRKKGHPHTMYGCPFLFLFEERVGYFSAPSSVVSSSASLLTNSVMPYSMRMLYHDRTLRMSETRTRSVS